MAIVLELASFPNSRIKPRPARTAGLTQEISIPATTTVLVSAANANRTSLNLRNIDTVTTIRYAYVTTAISTEGYELMAGEAIVLESPQDIYVYNPSGVAVSINYDEGVG